MHLVSVCISCIGTTTVRPKHEHNRGTLSRLGLSVIQPSIANEIKPTSAIYIYLLHRCFTQNWRIFLFYPLAKHDDLQFAARPSSVLPDCTNTWLHYKSLTSNLLICFTFDPILSGIFIDTTTLLNFRMKKWIPKHCEKYQSRLSITHCWIVEVVTSIILIA